MEIRQGEEWNGTEIYVSWDNVKKCPFYHILSDLYSYRLTQGSTSPYIT